MREEPGGFAGHGICDRNLALMERPEYRFLRD